MKLGMPQNLSVNAVEKRKKKETYPTGDRIRAVQPVAIPTPSQKTVHFFLILDCEAIGTAATPGLLCQPRVIVKMIVEKQMECRLAGETEVLGENLTQRYFCPSQNST
jgi:hypothetical protein